MKTIHSVISDAIDEVCDDNNVTAITTRKMTNRILKHLGESNHLVATWAVEQGVFKCVGFTSESRPKTISPVAITRGHVKVFTVDPEALTSGN